MKPGAERREGVGAIAEHVAADAVGVDEVGADLALLDGAVAWSQQIALSSDLEYGERSERSALPFGESR